MDILTGALAGLGVLGSGFLGKKLADRWNRSGKQKILENLNGLDDSLEKRFNIDIPDAWQSWYHKLIMAGVDTADSVLGNPQTLKQLIKFVVSGQFPNTELIISKLNDFYSNISSQFSIEDQIPSELKPLFNEFKLYITRRFVRSNIDLLPKVPEELTKNISAGSIELQTRIAIQNKTDSEITKDIESMVVVKKTQNLAVFPEAKPAVLGDPQATFKRLAEESEARQKFYAARTSK